MIKEFFQGIKNKKGKFNEMRDEDTMMNTLSDRKKSHDERELEKILERKRQEQITEQLKKIRSQENRESQFMTMLGGKDIFKGHTNIMNDNPLMMSNRHNMLKQRNIFAEGKF